MIGSYFSGWLNININENSTHMIPPLVFNNTPNPDATSAPLASARNTTATSAHPSVTAAGQLAGMNLKRPDASAETGINKTVKETYDLIVKVLESFQDKDKALRFLASLDIDCSPLYAVLHNPEIQQQMIQALLLNKYINMNPAAVNNLLGTALIDAGQSRLAWDLCHMKNESNGYVMKTFKLEDKYSEIVQPETELAHIIFGVSKLIVTEDLIFKLADALNMDFSQAEMCIIDNNNTLRDKRIAALSLLGIWMDNTITDVEAKNALRAALLNIDPTGKLYTGINTQAVNPAPEVYLSGLSFNDMRHDKAKKNDFIRNVSERISRPWVLQSLANYLSIPLYGMYRLFNSTGGINGAAEKLLTDWSCDNNYETTREMLGVALIKSGQSRLASDLCQQSNASNCYVFKKFTLEDEYLNITQPETALEPIIFEVSKHIVSEDLIYKLAKELNIELSQVTACSHNNILDVRIAALSLLREWAANTGSDAEAKNALRGALLNIDPTGKLCTGIHTQAVNPVPEIYSSSFSFDDRRSDETKKNDFIREVSERISRPWILQSLASYLSIPSHKTDGILNSTYGSNNLAAEKLLTDWSRGRNYKTAREMLGAALIKSGQSRLAWDLCRQRNTPGRDAVKKIKAEDRYFETIQSNISLERISFEVSKYIVSEDLISKLAKELNIEPSQVTAYLYNNAYDTRIAALSLLREWMDNTVNDSEAKSALGAALLNIDPTGKLYASICARACNHFPAMRSSKLLTNDESEDAYKKFGLTNSVIEAISSHWKFQSLANFLDIPYYKTDEILSRTYCLNDATRKLLTNWSKGYCYETTRKAIRFALIKSGLSYAAGKYCGNE